MNASKFVARFDLTGSGLMKIAEGQLLRIQVQTENMKSIGELYSSA